jgi:hypothetical protein
MTTDKRGQTCVFFYGKAGRFFPEQKGDYPARGIWT